MRRKDDIAMVNVALTKEQHQWLKDQADRELRSVGNMAQFIIARAMKSEAQPTPVDNEETEKQSAETEPIGRAVNL